MNDNKMDEQTKKCSFSYAWEAMKEGRRVKKGTMTYRLKPDDEGGYNLLMEYPIANFTLSDMLSNDWEVLDKGPEEIHDEIDKIMKNEKCSYIEACLKSTERNANE